MRLLRCGVVPNRRRLTRGPRGDAKLSAYMRWLMVTHAKP